MPALLIFSSTDHQLITRNGVAEIEGRELKAYEKWIKKRDKARK